MAFQVWVDPSQYIPVKTEVIYLLEKLDQDESKDLSLQEIFEDSKTFLESQMTYFGKIYDGTRNLRKSVFNIGPEFRSPEDDEAYEFL